MDSRSPVSPTAARDTEPPSARKSQRRDSNGAAERAFLYIVPHLEQKIRTLQSARGATPVDKVRVELRKHRPKKPVHENDVFWVGLQEEYELSGTTSFDRLDPPKEPEGIDADLGSAIEKTRAPNPAQRQLEDFRSFFVYCDVFNETEFYGAMMALRPHPNITTKQRHEMHEILLENIGKHQAARETTQGVGESLRKARVRP